MRMYIGDNFNIPCWYMEHQTIPNRVTLWGIFDPIVVTIWGIWL